MKDLTLVIMAAGMGSRFGGLKQIEPVGPSGEFILDYSVYDAIRAGFNKVIFIIKEENYDLFRDTVGKRIEGKINVEYVFQDIKNIPSGFDAGERVKPWGTGHAVYSAINNIHGNFAVINADDFYGRDAFVKIADFLRNAKEEGKPEFALVVYEIESTLAASGSVKRGMCKEKDGYLTEIIESNVEKIDGEIIATPLDGRPSFQVAPNAPASMTVFGYTPIFLEMLKEGIVEFFNKNKDNLEKCEYLMPDVVDNCIKEKTANIKVLRTTAHWYGVTYKEDKENLVTKINEYINMGEYPSNLWEKTK